jgi:hypothetical protein
MKFWFTKKTPKDMYDGKAPYDATVEQVLRVAQEVSATPTEAEREVFDFAKAFRAKAESALPVSIPSFDTPSFATPATAQPRVSRATREEMERRLASYRAFQKKLNDEREARIRRTMDDVRAKLKQSAAQNPPAS